MTLVRRLARTATAIAAAVTAASCMYLSAVFEDDFAASKIDDAYAARDDCLKWTIARMDDGAAEPEDVGARAARGCSAETGALVAATDPHGDPAVGGRIRADSQFRAIGYVAKLRQAASLGNR